MSYISRDFRCGKCGAEWDELVLREHQDDLQPCPACGVTEGKRCMRKPPGITKESFVDGTKRKGFQELKEANKLTMEMYNKPVEQRKEIQKEITNIKKTTKTEE